MSTRGGQFAALEPLWKRGLARAEAERRHRHAVENSRIRRKREALPLCCEPPGTCPHRARYVGEDLKPRCGYHRTGGGYGPWVDGELKHNHSRMGLRR